MARPIYPHELSDPDFSWLITNFRENFPNYVGIESSLLPVAFICITDKEYHLSMMPTEDLKRPNEPSETELPKEK